MSLKSVIVGCQQGFKEFLGKISGRGGFTRVDNDEFDSE